MVEALGAAGFSALTIDRGGYPDQAAALERQLRLVFKGKPLVSQDGRYCCYFLDPGRSR
jgi:hypothetical protein